MSEQITVKLPDGSTREYASGATPAEVAASIGKGLAKAAIAAKADGEWVDLDRPLDHHVSLEIVVPDSDDGREVLRHSTAHVMAEAVTRLFQPGFEGQAQSKEAVEQEVLGKFHFLPAQQVFRDRKIGDRVIVPAGGAELLLRLDRDKPVAGVVLGIAAEPDIPATLFQRTPRIAVRLADR